MLARLTWHLLTHWLQAHTVTPDKITALQNHIETQLAAYLEQQNQT